MVKFSVELVDLIYPVGSIYISTNNTNPSLLFGGNWQQIKDRFLLSCGDTYNNGATGGASTVSLTKAQMPRHTHTQNSPNHNSVSSGRGVIAVDGDDWTYTPKRAMNYSSGNYYYPYSTKNGNGIAEPTKTGDATPTNQYTGGTNTTQAEQNGSAHENMPPYLAVYVWERIAGEED